jgi:hypothetical protein
MNGEYPVLFLAAAIGVAACGTASAKLDDVKKFEPPPFSQYQGILDRMPFGPLPAGFNPDSGTPDPVATQTDAEVKADRQKLAKQVKMSCVNISPDGDTMVGFSDLSEKPQLNYYLAVGDTRNGWKIVAADYDGEWAKIEKDGVEITMKLGTGLVDDPTIGKAAAPAQPSSPQRFSLVRPTVSAGSGDATPGLTRLAGPHPAPAADASPAGGSFMERLKARAQKNAAEQAAREKASQDRLLKLAREAAKNEVARQKQQEEEEKAERQEQQQPPEGAPEPAPYDANRGMPLGARQ